ncbi:MAG TPA: bifunctional DNA-formamidopyrimidine glycosylase/DNA-(apurinic or apyrimidinic site) lyase [Solirubrobacteraceae bacterium]|jgi:formamidopyrimidine-DNA glycosylase
MPELPEVETIRRQLEPAVIGATLDAVEVLDPRWCEPHDAAGVSDILTGRRVLALRRRGKYLDWVFDGELHLLMHLRMTGALLLDAEPGQAYVRVRMAFDSGRRLEFSDPRRFGTGQIVSGDPALEEFFAGRLGIEPFDEAFTPQLLRSLARGKRVAIKTFLLDQRMIAGVGNIYADEALFRAGVHPLRAAGALRPKQYALLRDAVREVLSSGIDARGASIDDFRHLDGARGSFQDRFLVHRREGEPCTICGTAIAKIVVGGRGTYFCAHCQPVPRIARPAKPRGAQPAARSGRR